MDLVKKWINHNRFLVIGPVVGLIFWFVAVGCSAATPDPLNPARMISADELQTSFQIWQKESEKMMIRFDAARADIEKQQEQWNEFQSALMQLASGAVADWSGLVQLVLGGGLIGAVSDNVRKRGLIAGLKRNS